MTRIQSAISTGLTALFCLGLLTACDSEVFKLNNNLGSEDTPQPQGTQDGGGGLVGRSSEAQIRAAVEDAKALLKTESSKSVYFLNARENMSADEKRSLSDAYMAIFRPGEYYSSKLVAQLDAAGIEIESAEWEKAMTAFGETPEGKIYYLSDYIDSIPVTFEQNTPCAAPEKTNASASVTKLALDASVCFSISELSRIPPESILKHVTSMWAHELAHINGLQEPEAIYAEKMVLEVFAQLNTPPSRGLGIRVRHILLLAQMTVCTPYPILGEPAEKRRLRWAEARGLLESVVILVASYYELPVVYGPEAESALREVSEEIGAVLAKLRQEQNVADFGQFETDRAEELEKVRAAVSKIFGIRGLPL